MKTKIYILAVASAILPAVALSQAAAVSTPVTYAVRPFSLNVSGSERFQTLQAHKMFMPPSDDPGAPAVETTGKRSSIFENVLSGGITYRFLGDHFSSSIVYAYAIQTQDESVTGSVSFRVLEWGRRR